MTALNQSFNMFAGDTLDVTIYTKNQTGRMLDLTGAKIVWTAQRNKKSSEVILSKSTENGSIIVVDPQNGTFNFRLTENDTKLLIGRYFHRAKLYDVSNNVSTILIGDLIVS